MKSGLRWGQPYLSVHLQAVPDEACISSLCHVQDRLSTSLPASSRRVPPQALHCTIATLWSPTSRIEIGDVHGLKETVQPYIPAIGGIVDQVSAFALQFAEARLSPEAAIAFGQEPSVLQTIRARIRDQAYIFGDALFTPDIAHVTLHRFTEPFIPPETSQAWDVLFPITLPVVSLRLVIETAFPMLSYIELRSFELKGRKQYR